jgi:hypothetical protein
MEERTMTKVHDYASPEEKLYARWLDVGTKAGFAALIVTFLVHAFELLPPGIALEHLPRYWHLPVEEFIALTGAPTGWAWVARLGEGDLLNFVGVAILGTVTILCYARVLPLFLRAGERVFAAICVAEIVVLAAAAAGIFGTGH